jgi:acyl dehydratase
MTVPRSPAFTKDSGTALVPLAGPEDFRALQGRPPLASPWLRVDQEMIDRFAAATGDHQWIHVDAPRAAAESPYGRTIAHGFLSLSLLSFLLAGVFSYPGRKSSLNYGLDRVRFTDAVLVDSEVRALIGLAELREIGPAEVRVAWDVTLEQAGSPRPALVARWLVQMRY